MKPLMAEDHVGLATFVATRPSIAQRCRRSVREMSSSGNNRSGQTRCRTMLARVGVRTGVRTSGAARCLVARVGGRCRRRRRSGRPGAAGCRTGEAAAHNRVPSGCCHWYAGRFYRQWRITTVDGWPVPSGWEGLLEMSVVDGVNLSTVDRPRCRACYHPGPRRHQGRGRMTLRACASFAREAAEQCR
jgi:hypothetical protein